MPRERRLESDQDRDDRVERHLRERIEAKAAEDKALDEAVKQSIRLHGA